MAVLLKAVWIKSDDSNLSNHQATSKDKIFESSEKSVVGTEHLSPAEVTQSPELRCQKNHMC